MKSGRNRRNKNGIIHYSEAKNDKKNFIKKKVPKVVVKKFSLFIILSLRKTCYYD